MQPLVEAWRHVSRAACSMRCCCLKRKNQSFKSLISRQVKSRSPTLARQQLSVSVLCKCKRSDVVAQLIITMVPYWSDTPQNFKSAPSRVGNWTPIYDLIQVSLGPPKWHLSRFSQFSHSYGRVFIYFTTGPPRPSPQKLSLLFGD